MTSSSPAHTCAWSTVLLGLVLLLLPVAAAEAEVRTWMDATGKYKIEAEFISLNNDAVLLELSDGQRRLIPLSKLGADDQKFVRELTDVDNPFKAVDEPPADSSGPATIKVDRMKAPEIAIAGDQWEVRLAPPGEPEFVLKPIGLPKNTEFFEGISGVACNMHAKRAALSYHVGRREDVSTRLVIVDIESGSLLYNDKTPGKFTVLALHNDGQRIVLHNLTDEKDKGHLSTLQLDGKSMQTVDVWEPYGEEDDRNIVQVKTIGDDKLMTCNDAGNVVVWDFDTHEPLFRFDIPRTSRPTVSPDDRYVVFCGGDRVGFVDIQQRRTAASKAALHMNHWCKCAFSPSGKYLAASSLGKMMIWNTADGSVAFEGEFPGISLARGLQFPHDDFVLVSDKHLVQWATKIQLWDYSGARFTTSFGSTPVFCLADQSAGALIPLSLPHPAALQTLDDVKNQPDLFVLREGVDIRLDVSEVPGQYREQVTDALEKQVARLKCHVAAQSPLVLKAGIFGPENKPISYHFVGSFVLKRYNSTLEIRYDDKKMWSTRSTNTPSSLHSPRTKSYQEQIDEAGKSPNLSFFETATLPDQMQKPSDSAPTHGAASRRSIGYSTITINGLEDAN